MAKFLHAAYALRIKKMYDKIKEEKIPALLKETDSNSVNRRRVLNFILLYVGKAYREGIKYATVDVKQKFKKDIEMEMKIEGKAKNKLLVEFIARVMAAERVHDLKFKNYKKIKELQPGRNKRDDIQVEQIWNEYVNAIRVAVSNLLVRAGALGMENVYKKIDQWRKP